MPEGRTGPRHAAPNRRSRRRFALLTLALVVALAAGAFVGYRFLWPADAGTAAPAPSTTAPPTFDVPPPSTATAGQTLPADTPAAADGAGPCTVVSVLASLENADFLQKAAAAYAAKPRDVGGKCVEVTVTALTSGRAAGAAAAGFDAQRPTLWVPDSGVWVALARSNGATVVDPAQGTVVAQTGTVVAMPRSRAQATSWQAAQPTWKQIFATVGDATYWKSNGHPEWGAFTIAKTSPQVSTSGLFALMASYGAAIGKQTGFTAAEVTAASTVTKVSAAELTVSHYTTTPLQFLTRARQADAGAGLGTFVSAAIVDEKTVWDYNRGLSSTDGLTPTVGAPPKERLAPVYPAEGVYLAQSTAVPVAGPWVTPDRAAAGKDFVRFLTTRHGQQVARASGYRDVLGAADDQVRSVGGLRTSVTPMAVPATAVCSAVQKGFSTVRKRARVLFLVDVSGSMADPVAPGGVAKLEGARAAILTALNYFGGADEVGLSAFSNFRDQPVTPGAVTPVGPIGTTKPQLTAGLATLRPLSQTPLYAALVDAVSTVAQGYDPTKINAVVLLSDGENDSTVPGELQNVLDTVTPLAGSTPVLVFALAYGADAAAPPLQAVASASGGQYVDATDPSTLSEVLAELVTTF